MKNCTLWSSCFMYIKTQKLYYIIDKVFYFMGLCIKSFNFTMQENYHFPQISSIDTKRITTTTEHEMSLFIMENQFFFRNISPPFIKLILEISGSNYKWYTYQNFCKGNGRQKFGKQYLKYYTRLYLQATLLSKQYILI